MKKLICIVLAVLMLTAVLTGCSDTSTRSERSGRSARTDTNTETVRRSTAPGTDPDEAFYHGNVSTSRDGTVNGTNRYIGGFEDLTDPQ